MTPSTPQPKNSFFPLRPLLFPHSPKKMRNKRYHFPILNLVCLLKVRELSPEQIERAEKLAQLGPRSLQKNKLGELRGVNSHKWSSSISSKLAASDSVLPSLPDRYSSGRTSTQRAKIQKLNLLPHRDAWEFAALKKIRRKGLSLDKDWSQKTWMNKSTKFERLKLLRDDAVDIESLLKVSTTSEEIARACVRRHEMRKAEIDRHERCVNMSRRQLPEAVSVLKEPCHELRMPTQMTDFTYSRGPPAEPQTRYLYSPWRTLLEPHRRFSSVFDDEHDRTSNSTDDATKYSPGLVRIVHSRPAYALKRKSCEEPSEDNFTRPRTKRPRVLDREEIKESESGSAVRHALSLHIRREIFGRMSGGCVEQKPTSHSRIVIFLPGSCASPRLVRSYEVSKMMNISARSYEEIMKELRCIAGVEEDRDEFIITDSGSHLSQLPPEMYNFGRQHFKYFTNRINVYTDPARRVIIEGNATAMANMISRLRSEDLANPSEWEFDGMKFRQLNSVNWSLSEKTLNMLNRCMQHFRESEDSGGAEVQWRWTQSL